MGTLSGLAGLKRLHGTFRAVQLTGCLIILGVFTFYLVTLAAHDMEIRTGVKAVEGIVVLGALYAAHSLLLICVRASYLAVSRITLALDIGFAISFIYVAVENRAASGGCVNGTIPTVYGAGPFYRFPEGYYYDQPGVRLPTFQLACQLMMVCLVVSCLLMYVLPVSSPAVPNASPTKALTRQPSPFYLLPAILGLYINHQGHCRSQPGPVYNADTESLTRPDAQHNDPLSKHRRQHSGLRGFGGGGNAAVPKDSPVTPSAHTQFGESQTRYDEPPPPEYSEGVQGGHNTHGLYAEDEHGQKYGEFGKRKK